MSKIRKILNTISQPAEVPEAPFSNSVWLLFSETGALLTVYYNEEDAKRTLKFNPHWTVFRYQEAERMLLPANRATGEKQGGSKQMTPKERNKASAKLVKLATASKPTCCKRCGEGKHTLHWHPSYDGPLCGLCSDDVVNGR